MAATVTKVKGRGSAQIGATLNAALVDFTGDSSYATGGYAVTAASFGLKRLIAVVDVGPVTAGGALKPCEYDAVNGKVKITSAGVEVTNASNQSTVTRRLLAIGT